MMTTKLRDAGPTMKTDVEIVEAIVDLLDRGCSAAAVRVYGCKAIEETANLMRDPGFYARERF